MTTTTPDPQIREPSMDHPEVDADFARTLIVPSTDGVNLHVHELVQSEPTLEGRGVHAPFLIAHATGFHGRTYSVLARHLSHYTTRPILAPDLRGHGDSNSPSNLRYSWEGFAEDLVAILDRLEATQIKAFGHSKGGAALLRAEQMRPGSFSALYLYEPVVFPSNYGDGRDSPLVEASRRRRSRFPSFDAAVERFGSRPPLDVLDKETLEGYVRHGFRQSDSGEVILKLPGPEEAEVYRMSLTGPTWDNLDAVQSRVVIARGREAPVGPASVAPQVAERLGAKFVEYPDLGHFGPLEDPNRIGQEVARTLRLAEAPAV